MSLSRIGKRLATFGLALGLALGISARAHPQEKRKVQVVASNLRAFKIPFNIEPANRARYKQIQLMVSSDYGGHWEKIDTKSPDSPSFTFKAQRDGEFWFAVRTLDTANRLSPPDDADVEPDMKVVVDTVAPQINLEALPRRGSLVAVRWELIDERIDLNSLKLEYQVAGSADWMPVTIHKGSRIGRENWDAGTAEPLKVRMFVSDRAKNPKTVSLTIPDGRPRNRTPSDVSGRFGWRASAASRHIRLGGGRTIGPLADSLRAAANAGSG